MNTTPNNKKIKMPAQELLKSVSIANRIVEILLQNVDTHINLQAIEKIRVKFASIHALAC
jgi:hypothetical protein